MRNPQVQHREDLFTIILSKYLLFFTKVDQHKHLPFLQEVKPVDGQTVETSFAVLYVS